MNRTERPLAKMPYAQAKVITYYDDFSRVTERILVSYQTEVIILTYEYGKENFCHMRITGLYSRTTIKHISAFMKEYTPFDYFMAKTAYLKGINLEWKV